MDAEPVWLTFEDVRDIHENQITRFGGLEGIKDENLVYSAVSAPINLFHYEGIDDPLVLGIHLCAAVAQNHAFNDGNENRHGGHDRISRPQRLGSRGPGR